MVSKLTTKKLSLFSKKSFPSQSFRQLFFQSSHQKALFSSSCFYLFDFLYFRKAIKSSHLIDRRKEASRNFILEVVKVLSHLLIFSQEKTWFLGFFSFGISFCKGRKLMEEKVGEAFEGGRRKSLYTDLWLLFVRDFHLNLEIKFYFCCIIIFLTKFASSALRDGICVMLNCSVVFGRA